MISSSSNSRHRNKARGGRIVFEGGKAGIERPSLSNPNEGLRWTSRAKKFGGAVLVGLVMYAAALSDGGIDRELPAENVDSTAQLAENPPLPTTENGGITQEQLNFEQQVVSEQQGSDNTPLRPEK